MNNTNGVSFVRYLLANQPDDARGDFTALLTQISLGAKIISRELRQAGLIGQLGYTGETNVQGEKVKKLDIWSNDLFVGLIKETGTVCTMVSEEMETALHLPGFCTQGKYIVCFDPIDGSSNIDLNGVVGTIFSIRRREQMGEDHLTHDVLQNGTKQIAAGYIMYGPSTLLVYTAGTRVDAFTLDPNTREFFLTHPNIKIPKQGRMYSVNEGRSHYWHLELQKAVDYFRVVDPPSGRPYSLRYAGSLLADFHRILLEGGIFLYPADKEDPKKSGGKLRLLYEGAPMALIAEAAGGRASTGTERILDLIPTSYHKRTPLVIGSAEDVSVVEDFYQGRR
jgi:fructose-1,6-bisphosphatase I